MSYPLQFSLNIAGGPQVLVDFTATWCGPCRMMSPLFEKAAGDFQGITFIKVDVDEAKASVSTSAVELYHMAVNLVPGLHLVPFEM